MKNNIFPRVSTLLTRPADTTAYASGDLVANNVTAGSVIPLNMPVRASQKKTGLYSIRRVKLKKSGTGVTNASFRVHFYTAAPTVTNGDNGAWLSINGGWIGSVDITVDKAFSDGAAGIGALAAGAEIIGRTASGVRQVWALIEARGAYTPASAETFQLTAEVADLDQEANA